MYFDIWHTTTWDVVNFLHNIVKSDYKVQPLQHGSCPSLSK
jgi:hypothetical protein